MGHVSNDGQQGIPGSMSREPENLSKTIRLKLNLSKTIRLKLNSTKTLKPGFAKYAVDTNLFRLGFSAPACFLFYLNYFCQIHIDLHEPVKL